MSSGEVDLPGKPGWLLRSALILCLLWLPNEPAIAGFIHLPYSKHSSVDGEEVRSSPEGIRIRVQNKLLQDVLQHIQNESGIRFTLHDDLFDLKITIQVKAIDWTSAVRELLENFSRIEIWNDDGGLSSVRLLKSEDYTMPNQNTSWMVKVVKPAENRKSAVRHIVRGKKFKIFLSKKELLELVKAPAGSPLPDYFVKDLLYRKFLEQFGFDSIEDVFDIKNTKAVRLEVVRQLEELEKRNRDSVK